MEDILVELEYKKRKEEIEKEKAKECKAEAERLREEINLQRKKLEATKQKILDKANLKAKEILKQAEDETEKVLKEVRQAARKAQVTIDEKGLQEVKQNMKETVGKQQNIINKTIGSKTTYKKVPKNIKLGEEVIVTHLMQQGVVIGEADNSGNVMVRVGILPIKVHVSNLQRANKEEEKVSTSQAKKKTPVRTNNVSHQISKTANIKTEVDVRGMLVDEALPVVDKYLDDAYLAGLKQATIIHGKGTGALRAAITNMLKRHPHIASYRPGKYGEGEAGVTVVEIK